MQTDHTLRRLVAMVVVLVVLELVLAARIGYFLAATMAWLVTHGYIACVLWGSTLLGGSMMAAVLAVSGRIMFGSWPTNMWRNCRRRSHG